MLYERVDVQTAQRSEPRTIPAPVGGLNGRDSLANMAETDAYMLDNVFPGTSTCRVRKGITRHAHGLGGPVSSLEVFGGATDRLLAFVAPHVYDVTVRNSPVTLKDDLNSDKTVAVMFATVADSTNWLIITTGQDIPMSYDGSAIADLAITGTEASPAELNFVASYQGRLFFASNNKLGFYYLQPGAIQGAAEYFDLGQLCKTGGFLQAIATYSEDAGDGPNDYIVFITNRGEYLMFFGTDPGDVNSWQLVGRYKASEPIGRKCVLDYAGDLIVLTVDGAIQFSQIRKLADTRFELTALTSKLGDILTRLNAFRDNHGWCMALYPAGGWLVVSAPGSPTRTGEYFHFVMNTTTMAWCRFTSREWDGHCFAVANKRLYLGRQDGTVRLCDEGQSDNDTDIQWLAKQAYNYFNTPQYKHFKWAQFLVKSEAPVVLSANLSVDYVERRPQSPSSPIAPTAGAEWDKAHWDADFWGFDAYTQRWIASWGVYGVAASHWLQGSLKGASLEWFATEHVFEKAQGLLG